MGNKVNNDGNETGNKVYNDGDIAMGEYVDEKNDGAMGDRMRRWRRWRRTLKGDTVNYDGDSTMGNKVNNNGKCATGKGVRLTITISHEYWRMILVQLWNLLNGQG